MDDLEEGEIDDGSFVNEDWKSGQEYLRAPSKSNAPRNFWKKDGMVPYDQNQGYEVHEGVMKGGFNDWGRATVLNFERGGFGGPVPDHGAIHPGPQQWRGDLHHERRHGGYQKNRRRVRLPEKESPKIHLNKDADNNSSHIRPYNFFEPHGYGNQNWKGNRNIQNLKPSFHRNRGRGYRDRGRGFKNIGREQQDMIYPSNYRQQSTYDPYNGIERQSQYANREHELRFHQSQNQQVNENTVAEPTYNKMSDDNVIASYSSKESDEYDLDDFQLLLERHRLIQQQLSAIGKQEQVLKENITSNEFFDEKDFEIIPNPNSIEHDSEETSDFQEQNLLSEAATSEGSKLGPFSFADEIPHDSETQVSLVPTEPSAELNIQEQNLGNPTEIIDDIRNVSLDEEPPIISDTLGNDFNNMQTRSSVLDQRIIVQNKTTAPVKFQMSKRKQRKRMRWKRFKNQNPNIAQFVKVQNNISFNQKKQARAADFARRQHSKKELPFLKKNLSENLNKDDYQTMPMDLEDEYEDIDKLVDEDYYSEICAQEADDVALIAAAWLNTENTEAKVDVVSSSVEDISEKNSCLVSTNVAPLSQAPGGESNIKKDTIPVIDLDTTEDEVSATSSATGNNAALVDTGAKSRTVLSIVSDSSEKSDTSGSVSAVEQIASLVNASGIRNDTAFPVENPSQMEASGITDATTGPSIAAINKAVRKPEGNKVAQPEDDHDDDLLLRQQLLQSLATKRAEKARAMIAEQSSPPVVPSKVDQTKTVKNTTRTITSVSSKPTMSRIKSDSDIVRKIKSPTIETSFPKEHEKVIIQIGNDSDSDEDEVGSDNEAVSNSLSGAINDLLHEARHGTKTSVVPPASEKSVPSNTSSDEATKSMRENTALVASLQKCILDAHVKLENQRSDAKKDDSTLKSLLKRISVRKQKIEQQNSKITRLKDVLAKLEKAQMTLTSQCNVFEAQVKSLNQRINLRTEKTSSLEEELLRARSILSATKKRVPFMDSPDRGISPGSPAQSDSGKNSTDNEGSSMLNEQIKRSIQKMKLALVKKSSELVTAAVRSRLPSKRRIKPEKGATEPSKKLKQAQEKSTVSQVQGNIGRSELQNTKEKLQKLERELREKLERMKALSALKRRNIAGKLPDTGDQRKVNSELVPSGTATNKNTGASSIDLRNVIKSRQKPDKVTGKPKVNPDSKISAQEPNPDSFQLTRTVINFDECPKGLQDGQAHDTLLQGDCTSQNSDSETDENTFIDYSEQAGLDERDVRLETKMEDVLESLLKDESKLKNVKEEQVESLARIPVCMDTLLSEEQYKKSLEIKSLLEKELAKGKKTEETKRETLDESKTHRNDGTNYKYRSYTSPLLCFRSYRLCPYFRTREKKSISSNTYSNKIKPRISLCPYDLTGKCLDETCKEQHLSSCISLKEDELLKDIILYEPKIAGIQSGNSNEVVNTKAEKFIDNYRKQYRNIKSTDQLVLLLISDIKSLRRDISKGKYVYYNNVELNKRWHFRRDAAKDVKDAAVESKKKIWSLEKSLRKSDFPENGETQELRYFEEDYDIMKSLENAVTEDPLDVVSWMALAEKTLVSQTTDESHRNTEEIENKALNILSRALEANPTSESLWETYLNLYSKKRNPDELRELCMQAIEYCRSYNIWLQVLLLESKHESKMDIWLDMIEFLVENSEQSSPEVKSHRILETLLYMVQLEVSKESIDEAMDILWKALSVKSHSDSQEDYLPVIFTELLIGDMVTLWIVYLSIAALKSLPIGLFDPCDSRPSKIVSKNAVRINWASCKDSQVDLIQGLFKDGVSSIESHSDFSEKNISSFLPFFENWIEFEMKKGNPQITLTALENFAAKSKHPRDLMLLMLKTMMKISKTADIILFVESNDGCCCFQSDEIVYVYASWLVSKERQKHAVEILNDAVFRRFNMSNKSNMSSDQPALGASPQDSLNCYRRLLNISTELLTNIPAIAEEAKVNNKDRDYAFIWLNYCLLLEINNETAEEAYEIAVNSYTSTENRKILWLEYLNYFLRKLERSTSKLEYIEQHLDITRRCITSIPSSVPLQYDVGKYWNDFSFHNLAIENCLDILPKSQVGAFLEESLKMMPLNVKLAVRTCYFEMKSGNPEQARQLYGFVLKKFPHLLDMWRVAIWVEVKCGGIREARWLYEEATKMLPYCKSIWKDRVLFELAYGSSSEAIQKTILEIAGQANDCGINVLDIVKSVLQ